MAGKNSNRFRTQYSDAANTDLMDAVGWYSSRKVRGLGSRFAKSVKSAVKRIETNPYAFSIRFSNVRFCHTETFPYVVQYTVDEAAASILVTAILYIGREPGIGRGRSTDFQEDEDQ